MKTNLPRLSAGFTLVEIMVGLLIGLIGTVVIFQVFAVSEGQKRTTTGAGDAQQNGVFSLFQMERDLRMAGFGFNYAPLFSCDTQGWDYRTNQQVRFPLQPVRLTNGAAGTPDSITVAYGDSELFVAPAKISLDITNIANPFRVINRYGFRPGDVIVVGDPGVGSCTLHQVSALTGGSLDVPHLTGTFTNTKGQIENTRFNPGNVAATYSMWNDSGQVGGRIIDLGAQPVVVTYSIQNDRLVATDGLSPGSANSTVELADGVVQLQAQYGFDGNGDGRMSSGAASVAAIDPCSPNDQWGDSMNTAVCGPALANFSGWAAVWARVIAVRLVVVARSLTPERPDPATGVCNATTANPQWMAKGVGLDVTANPDWRCYRYRPFEVVVPLRNLSWFARAS